MVTILSGTIGFIMLPALAFVGFMSVSDNAPNDSTNQSAKETLYTPPTQDEKYNARLGVPRRGEAGRIRALLLILWSSRNRGGCVDTNSTCSVRGRKSEPCGRILPPYLLTSVHPYPREAEGRLTE